jgi:hypothetical protein
MVHSHHADTVQLWVVQVSCLRGTWYLLERSVTGYLLLYLVICGLQPGTVRL